MPKHNSVASKQKSDNLVADYIYDLKTTKKDEAADEVYVARVIKMLGNARIQVVYSPHKDKVIVAQAKIPGRFTGRAKRDMMVSPGTFVLISDTGVVGSLALEMAAIVTRDELLKIQDLTILHPNVVSVVTDAEELSTRVVAAGDDAGFDFLPAADNTAEIDVDNI